MKNRLIPMLLSVVLSVCFAAASSVAVFAQQDFTVSVSSKSVKKGTDTVTLDISLKNNPGIAGVTMDIEFDNTALEVKSVTEGSLSEFSLITGNGSQSPYRIVLVNFAGEDVKADGKLVSMEFEILDSSKTGKYEIKVNSNSDADKLFVINQSGESVPHETVSGFVTVTSANNSAGSPVVEKDDEASDDKASEDVEKKDDEELSSEKWINPFTDVKEDNWFFDAVEYVVTKGLFNGVSAAEFAPNISLTRAMLVTVLYRAEGEPEISEKAGFADVAENTYYAKAVDWAKANGIVNGVTDTEFAPNMNITREQIAAIMFRYSVHKGMAAVGLAEHLHFDDADAISEYAVFSMNWAVGTGLISGRTENLLSPRDNATRAEAATILMRYFTQHTDR